MRCKVGPAWLWSKSAMLLCFSLSASAHAAEPLRVVLEISPPHQTLENGKVGGLTTTVVEAMLQHAGLTPVYEVYPWARAFRIAATTPDVLIYNMARTPERENSFHWIGTVAVYQLGFVALAHRQDITIQSLQDARPYSIAIQRDDLSANFLLQHGFLVGTELVVAADIIESWQLLVHGKVDLVIDDPVALTEMAKLLAISVEQLRFVYAIPELAQHTWLAASLQTAPQLIMQLQQAHAVVAKTDFYQQVMLSRYGVTP